MKKLFVYASGAVSILPLLAFVAVFTLELPIALVAPGTLLIGIAFAVHAITSSTLETTHKVMWAFAVVALLPAFTIPTYWFTNIHSDLAWQQYAEF